MKIIELSILLVLICLIFVIAGISSTLGLGGGAFYVPIFLYVGGLSMKEAAPLSLIIILGVSTISTLNHSREHRIYPKTGLFLELFTLVGAVCGVYINLLLPEETLRVWFGSVLFIFGGWSLWSALKARQSVSQPKEIGSITNLSLARKMLVAILAFFAGVIAGGLGIGGGVIKVPLLVYVLNIPMVAAAGTSALMIMITSICSGLIYYLKGQLNVEHAVIFLVSGISGAYLCTQFSTRKLESQQLRTIFAFFLILIAVFSLIAENRFHPI